MKETGVVKWFNDRRGYGFITREAGPDVFVHYSDIEQQEGRKTLREGQEVQFEVAEGSKGLKAAQVEVV